MAKGGARNRSGPQPDPMSLRSAARGLEFTALPATGFDGDAPEFPLPESSARELEFWEQLWRTPQACAWAIESWRWPLVAMYVRTFVFAESVDEPNAALLGQVHRLGDQVGLTPAGLKENGWAIARDQVAQKREAKKSEVRAPSSRDRMKVVSGDGS